MARNRTDKTLLLLLLASSVLTYNPPIIAAGESAGESARSAEASQRNSQDTQTTTSEKNYAAYTFSKIGRGGLQIGYNAGDHVLLEVMEATPAASNKVTFRITSRIPEVHSRIGRIGFDLGKYKNMIIHIETDKATGRYYHAAHNPQPFVHAFWPDFKADYMAFFKIDPKIAKPNDPRSLSPGNSLSITATLAPGIQYQDVVEALNRGLVNNDGLRVAIVASHLGGPPLPGSTRMDDGGYFTGRLVRASGPHVRQRETQPSPTAPSEPTVPPVTTADNKDIIKPAPVPKEPPSNPRNPWCRFCPE